MWKKIILGLITLIALVVGFVFYATSGMTDTANEFFIYVKSKHYDDAYNMLSEEFKASTDQKDFISFIEKSSLTNYKDVNWHSRSIDEQMGTLEGTIITRSGEKIPLQMKFIKKGDTWKIYSIFKPASGLVSSPESEIASDTHNAVPSEKEINSLVKATTKHFAEAIKAKDFTKFYQTISSLWQQQTSPNKLAEAFSPFFDNIDFTTLNTLQPILDSKPTVTKENILKVKGHYDTFPNRISFEYSYIKENDAWKLFSIYIFTTSS
jgi:hypothetical protein